VDGIATVSDAEIAAAMRRLLEVLKIVVEPSGSVAYAAVAEGKVDVAGRRVGIILSGGNVDLGRLPWAGAAP
jgi:threonine dehydratase